MTREARLSFLSAPVRWQVPPLHEKGDGGAHPLFHKLNTHADKKIKIKVNSLNKINWHACGSVFWLMVPYIICLA